MGKAFKFIKERSKTIHAAFHYLWPWINGVFWILGSFDLFFARVLDKATDERIPRLLPMIPWYGWVIIWLILLFVMMVEYATRQRLKSDSLFGAMESQAEELKERTRELELFRKISESRGELLEKSGILGKKNRVWYSEDKGHIDCVHEFFRLKIDQGEQLRARGLKDSGFMYEGEIDLWRQEVASAITEVFGDQKTSEFMKQLPSKNNLYRLSALRQSDDYKDYSRLTLENGITEINKLISTTFTKDLVSGFSPKNLKKYEGTHLNYGLWQTRLS